MALQLVPPRLPALFTSVMGGTPAHAFTGDGGGPGEAGGEAPWDPPPIRPRPPLSAPTSNPSVSRSPVPAQWAVPSLLRSRFFDQSSASDFAHSPHPKGRHMQTVPRAGTWDLWISASPLD